MNEDKKLMRNFIKYSISGEDIAEFLNNYAQKGMHLLDVGCGNGSTVARILSDSRFAGIQYVGLDYNKKTIEEVKNTENMQFIYGDACTMPFSDSEFDIIVLSHVFEHIKDSDQLCRELNRVLKPHGKLLVIVPIEKGGVGGFINKHGNIWKDIKLALEALNLVSYNLPSPHVHFLTFQEYKRYLRSKFNIVDAYGRGGILILMFSVVHSNMMVISRQRFNFKDFLKQRFPKLYTNSYKKSKNRFVTIGTFICSKKNPIIGQ